MKYFRVFLTICLIALCDGVQCQEVILDKKLNRFLINEQSEKPRLDIIVQNFTDYERNIVSKKAIMDIKTKPTFEKVSETEYNITASRMGEKLTFVIRNYEKLEDGYSQTLDIGNKEPTHDTEMLAWRYILSEEKCAAMQNVPFGVVKAKFQLLDNKKNLLYKLNVTLTYPKPELAYINVRPYGDLSGFDSLRFKNYIENYNQVSTVYSAGSNVPKRIIVSETDLYFGFKQAYFDGRFNPANIYTKVNNSAWRGTGKADFPNIHLYYEGEEEWNWLESGKYKLFYSYDKSENNRDKYEFEINNSWPAVFIHRILDISKLIVIILFSKPWVLAILLAIILFANYGNRLRQVREKAKKTNLELQSIQAQLNPHFVFNALGSVQGLINKNETEKANRYLTDFSKLLRNSLNNNGKEKVPLSEELQMLDKYIKLENLRFNFQYQVFVEKEIEPSQVEVPSLLIQPLIENAIKHGVSVLGEKGKLKISFLREETDLIVWIQDNGTGFNVDQNFDGKGIKLTKERIQLLNKQGNHIKLNFESSTENGSLAQIRFKHSFS